MIRDSKEDLFWHQRGSPIAYESRAQTMPTAQLLNVHFAT